MSHLFFVVFTRTKWFSSQSQQRLNFLEGGKLLETIQRIHLTLGSFLRFKTERKVKSIQSQYNRHVPWGITDLVLYMI